MVVSAYIESNASPDSFEEFWGEQSKEVQNQAQEVLSKKIEDIYVERKLWGMLKWDRIDEEWATTASANAKDSLSGDWKPSPIEGADSKVQVAANKNFKQLQEYMEQAQDKIGAPYSGEKIYEFLLRAEATEVSDVVEADSVKLAEDDAEPEPVEAVTVVEPKAEAPKETAEPRQDIEPKVKISEDDAELELVEAVIVEEPPSETQEETVEPKPVVEPKAETQEETAEPETVVEEVQETTVFNEETEIPKNAKIGSTKLIDGTHVIFKYDPSGKPIGHEGSLIGVSNEQLETLLNDDYRTTMRANNHDSGIDIKEVKKIKR